MENSVRLIISGFDNEVGLDDQHKWGKNECKISLEYLENVSFSK